MSEVPLFLPSARGWVCAPSLPGAHRSWMDTFGGIPRCGWIDLVIHDVYLATYDSG
jgi:hypothetical protein